MLNKWRGKIFRILFFFVLLQVAVPGVFAQDYSLFAKIDSHNYQPGDWVNISVEVWNGTAASPNTNVSVAITNSSSNTTFSQVLLTDSSGKVNYSIKSTNATSAEGEYIINFSIKNSTAAFMIH